MDLVDDRRRGRDQVEIELALEALLDDLQMQQAEEAAAETEAERGRTLRLVHERGVVEAKLGEALAQPLEIRRVDGEQAAEHDRQRRLEPGQRRRGRPALVGDRVADLDVGDRLDARGDEPDLARPELTDIPGFGREDADAVDLVGRGGGHHADLLAPDELAVLDAHENDDAEIGVVPGIDEQCLERRADVALRRRQPLHQRLEHLVDVEAGLRRHLDRMRGVDADHVLDLLLHALGIGGGQIDLVEHRHDLVPVVDRLVDVGEGLRLDALRRHRPPGSSLRRRRG